MNSVIEDHLPYMTNGSEYPPVRTKRDFVKRYESGEFGNRSPTWNTLQEFKDSGYQGLIHLRNRITGGLTWYNVVPMEVDLRWNEALESGLSPSDLYISAMAPAAKTIIQGEILQSSDGGLSLFCSTVKKPMREALKEKPLSLGGIYSQTFLKTYLCPKSYDWMNVLLDRYPFHVIEFSTYSVNWGTIPNMNTIWWEVRDY